VGLIHAALQKTAQAIVEAKVEIVLMTMCVAGGIAIIYLLRC
jgi:hypothetical protein